MMKYAAWLVYNKRFVSVDLTQDRVGHTHGRQDQRFSVVGFELSKCATLEDPEAFETAIKEKVKPMRGRRQHVEQVRGSYDWKGFFDNLDVSVSGHTQTKDKTLANLEAVHVFRFARRGDMHGVDEITSSFSCEPSPDNVVLCCKLYQVP